MSQTRPIAMKPMARPERMMHGFHASECKCSYGLVMFLTSFGLAGTLFTVAWLIA